MNIDLISEGAWISIIHGTRKVQFEFLALQLFLVNLRNRLQTKEISTQDCIRELKAFYTKFSRLPMAEKDFNKIANLEQPMNSRLLHPKEVARRITAGQCLMVAGEEQLLSTLPPGNWIGGTIPYFMASDGGCLCKDKIFVTEIPGQFQASVHKYAASELPGLYRDADEGSVSFVILPADSPTHTEFALRAPHYPSFAMHPLVGWIAGVDLASLGKAAPKVFCGSPQPHGDAAAVMRLKLPADRLAQIKIINLFQPGNGDTISFSASGFSAATALINGQERKLAQYLHSINADTRLPLVGNHCGAMINVSLKNLDLQRDLVEFYAPVIAGIEYKLASPLKNYVSEFEARLNELTPDNVLFSCNCILNYLYSNLEGHRTGTFVGPVTFGEIAYQLLNQTLVYLEIVTVASPPADPHATTLELSAAHEELQASERRFRALSESAPIGIFLTDNADRVIYDNPRCRKLRGLSTDDPVLGDQWIERVHPSDFPAVLATLKESERQGSDFDREFRFVGSDGQTRWAHSRTAVLRSETGQITGRIGAMEDITERKLAEIELERLNQDLVNASREAGMAEVATGVLHNVKNVVNSVNISADLISEKLRDSKAAKLTKVTALLREHAADLGHFITEDPKGKLLPVFLEQLAQQLAAEHTAVLAELQSFATNVEHIKNIITIQQNNAKQSGTSEKVNPVELMDDSFRIVAAGLARHDIQVVRQNDPNLPQINTEKHKVLQILVNFIRNAKHACQDSGRPDKKLVLQVSNGGEFIHFAVSDNGVGIPSENLSRLFENGFTTKKDGHGFGLRSTALAVRQLGGDIQAHSDGVGKGATFTLNLPLSKPVPK
jgi:PAS domain S-box-containing protein